MPYEYEEILKISSNRYFIHFSEIILHRLHKEHKYKPMLQFGGHKECFCKIDFSTSNKILDLIKSEESCEYITSELRKLLATKLI